MRRTGELRGPLGLSPGDHVCWPYDGQSSWCSAAGDFLAQGAVAGDQLLYVTDGSRQEMLDDLGRLPNRDGMLASGQLSVAPVDEAYGLAGSFDGARQVEKLHQRATRAVDSGYRALRIATDGSALVSTPAQTQRLAAYEVAVDSMIERAPLVAMCGFDIDRVAGRTSALCCVHPLYRAADSVGTCNFFVDDGVRRLVGEVDIAGMEDLEIALDAVADANVAEVVIDMSGVDFIDVAGTRALVALAAQLRPDRRLVVRHPPTLLRWMLRHAWGPVPGLHLDAES